MSTQVSVVSFSLLVCRRYFMIWKNPKHFPSWETQQTATARVPGTVSDNDPRLARSWNSRHQGYKRASSGCGRRGVHDGLGRLSSATVNPASKSSNSFRVLRKETSLWNSTSSQTTARVRTGAVAFADVSGKVLKCCSEARLWDNRGAPAAAGDETRPSPQQRRAPRRKQTKAAKQTGGGAALDRDRGEAVRRDVWPWAWRDGPEQQAPHRRATGAPESIRTTLRPAGLEDEASARDRGTRTEGQGGHGLRHHP